MTAASSSYWLIVKITGKLFTDGTSKTFYFSTRPVLDSTATTYYPIILSVSAIGQDHDRLAPANRTGSVTLYDGMNSFGVERKFSDFLQRYSFVDQTIEIYIQSTAIDTETFSLPSSNWKGKITDIQRSGAEITISAESRVFKRKPITRRISPTDFTAAPLKSAGKHLPIILGSNVQVSPVLITAEGPAESNEWAYATTYKNTFGNIGIQAYYVKDEEGDFREVLSAASTSTPVATLAKATTTHQSDEADIAISFLSGIGGASNNNVITHASVWWYPVGAPFTDGVTFIYEIWEDTLPSIADVLGEKVGEGTRYYSSQSWSAETEVEICFSKPIITKQDVGYYLVTKVREDTTSITNYFVRSAKSSTTSYLKFDEAQNQWVLFTDNEWFYSIYGAAFTDTPTPSSNFTNEGLGASTFEVEQRAAPTGMTLPDISKLEWVVEVNGLKDDGSGSVSGTPGTLFTRPDQAIFALSYEWGGSSFSASGDWYSPGASSPYTNPSRSVGGALEGEVFFEDAVRQICENSASRVYQRNDGYLVVYAWGSHLDLSLRLGPHECRVENWTVLDPSNVINSVRMSYAHSLIYFNELRAAIDDIPGDYTGYLTLNSTDVQGAVILGTSETLYGKRYLDNSVFPLINDSTSARSVAISYLAQFRHPPVYCDVIVPYDPVYSYGPNFDPATDLQPLEVIEVTHPEFPAYFGSSYSSKLPDYSGTLVEVNSGYDYMRAETYRMQIESRAIEFSTGSAPVIRWRCRVLTNAPYDPT